MQKIFCELCKYVSKNSSTGVSFSEDTGGLHWAESVHCSVLMCEVTMKHMPPLNFLLISMQR